MHTIVRLSVRAAWLLLFCASIAAAEVPLSVTVQGALRDEQNRLVGDAWWDVSFTGWDDPTGGNLLWSENKTLQTKDGLFLALLDGAGPAGMLSQSGQQYLQIQVAGSAPLLPRIPLGSVPSALRAARVDGDIVTGPGSLAINEEGVQVVVLESGTVGGGGGGGSVAIGEEGVQIVRIAADSVQARITAGRGVGDGDAILHASPGSARYNFFETWPCGAGDVEVGSEGLAFRCTVPGLATPDTTAYIDRDGNMGLDGDLTVGGDICAVGTIRACSDARYKTDVRTLEGALERVGRIRGVNFRWRTEEFPPLRFRSGTDMGFIAQELREVAPEVVTLGRDGYYTVDYARLTPLLVEATKELDARTRRLQELERRVADIEASRQAEWSSLARRLEELERNASAPERRAQVLPVASGAPE